jgi:hypothetical protein
MNLCDAWYAKQHIQRWGETDIVSMKYHLLHNAIHLACDILSSPCRFHLIFGTSSTLDMTNNISKDVVKQDIVGMKYHLPRNAVHSLGTWFYSLVSNEHNPIVDRLQSSTVVHRVTRYCLNNSHSIVLLQSMTQEQWWRTDTSVILLPGVPVGSSSLSSGDHYPMEA